MSSYIPAAAPAPVHTAPPTASSRASIEKKSNGTSDVEDTSSDDPSFMSALLANLMGSNQSFAVNMDTDVSSDENVVPVKFGGTFNMDPAMLVLPEGVSATTLVNADGTTTFNTELIAALTPGVPSDVAVPEGEADPRLIAAGLSPSEMTNLMTKLAAVSDSAMTTEPVTATDSLPDDSALSIISFLPDAAETGSVKPVTPDKVISAQVVASADATVDKVADTALAQVVSLMQPAEDDSEGFDPVEFRLTVKPSRYGSVSLYTAPAASAPVATPVAAPGSASAGSDTAIKGVMQHVSADASGPGFTSALAANTAAGTDSSLTGSFDPLLAATTLTATPAQSGGVTNPVLQNITATQSQPATQAVAALIVRNAQNSNGTQTLAVQLDPPELGKLQLKMRYERGEPLKVHVVLEKADTLAMFQRNAHALENALNQAGVQTDGSSLTFDLAQDNAFQQAMGQDGGSSGQKSAWSADAAVEVVDSTMTPVYTDPATGLTRYNIYA